MVKHKSHKIAGHSKRKVWSIPKVQCIRSEESLLLQLTDLLMGAISYEINVQEKKAVQKKRS